MSDKEITEKIDGLYKEIVELRNEQNEFRISITKYVTSMSRDTEWMCEKIDDINNKFDKCNLCKSSEEIIEKINDNKENIKNIKDNDIRELRDSQSKIKYTAGGISVGVSIITVIVLFILKIKDVF